MFGNLKNRLRKKDYDNDLEDIRSNVLGDFRGMPPQPEPDFPRRDRPVDVPAFDDPFSKGDRFQEPPGFSTIDTRFSDQRTGERRDGYEIIDRLNLIESQLSAIRSQTETINERLKNMERSMGKRY